MKKSIFLSIALITLCTSAWGCADFTSHNSYLFSVFRREMLKDELFTERTNNFWKEYTNGECKSYRWNEEEIMTFAKNKRDNEMVSYLEQLNKYLDISQQLGETWTYPTKQELQQRQRDLNNMIRLANAYKGTKLKPQWTLLQMRANMVLGNHANNITLFEQKAKKMPASVYRDMMENIYAGALLHQGKRQQAFDIYATQGDMVSIKWAMRKMRNLGGIRTIYQEAPNSPSINFLVQDFVNNAQETLDSKADKEWVEETLDHRIILKNEVDNFINYANKVVKEGKTQSPAMWMAAIGELQWLYGNYNEAYQTLDKATTMNGTQRMKDNARAIRMVVSVDNAKLGREYSQWMTEEMKWLIGKIKEEANGDEYSVYFNHYYDVLDRLVYGALAPKYKKNGQPDMAAALIRMMESGKVLDIPLREGENTRPSYSGDYTVMLEEMTPEQLEKHYKFVTSKSNDPFEAFVKSKGYYDINFYEDYLGTRCLANEQYKNAIEHLKKVPLKFMEEQNISYYLAHRDYTKPMWTERQQTDENTDGPNLGKLTKNPKLEFCQEMIQLLNQYTLANETSRAKIAYDLAKRYYQASYKGDCWYLTEYGKSVYDTAHVDRPDFVQKAIDYLEVSATSSDPSLHLNSLYALAYIPTEPWCNIDYDWENNREIITPLRNNRQFKALGKLNAFVNQRSTPLPVYITKCDVLKQFRKFN